MQEKDETAKSTVQIFNIRTAEEKEIFYRQVVPEVPTPDTTYDYENMKAKKWHKSVLAQIFLDLEPISIVTKPGFLMGARLIDANFKVPSVGYYTSLVDKVYENSHNKIKTLEDIHCLRFWEKFALVGAGNPVKNAFMNVAKRFLTATATSVACERMFSGASNILEEKRARLDPERLNRILFVRQNFVMSNCTLDY